MALNLKIVPCESIVPLSYFSRERVASLEITARDSGTIKNPLLAAITGDNKYLLLDDAAVLEMARRLKIEFLPIQVTELRHDMPVPSGAIIDKWNREYIERFRGLFPRVFICPVSTEKSLYGRKSVEIVITDFGKDPLRLGFKRDGNNRLPGAFFDFLTFLRRHFRFSHLNGLGKPDSLTTEKRTDSAVLNCPDITAGDIAAAIESGHLFPPELFAFDYGSRILEINYPIHILNDTVPLEDKEQFLHELINLRINSGKTRYISGGVYLLNY